METLDEPKCLVDIDTEASVTEFEFQLWRAFHGFQRWQEDCREYLCHHKLTNTESTLLHLISMNGRPKTVYELNRLLNRDDSYNVQYHVTQLLKKGFIEKTSETKKRSQTYQTTEKGKESVEEYLLARRDILMKLFKDFGFDGLKLEEATQALSKLKGIYDEASRLATIRQSSL